MILDTLPDVLRNAPDFKAKQLLIEEKVRVACALRTAEEGVGDSAKRTFIDGAATFYADYRLGKIDNKAFTAHCDNLLMDGKKWRYPLNKMHIISKWADEAFALVDSAIAQVYSPQAAVKNTPVNFASWVDNKNSEMADMLEGHSMQELLHIKSGIKDATVKELNRRSRPKSHEQSEVRLYILRQYAEFYIDERFGSKSAAGLRDRCIADLKQLGLGETVIEQSLRLCEEIANNKIGARFGISLP